MDLNIKLSQFNKQELENLLKYINGHSTEPIGHDLEKIGNECLTYMFTYGTYPKGLSSKNLNLPD